jgi:hypothetical protein
MINRMVGQRRRHDRATSAVEDARNLILAIAYHSGVFNCSKDLTRIASKAGWGSAASPKTTGRVMKELIFPMEKSGVITEVRDDNDHFIGYTLTESGQALFLGDEK